jgi:predicted component of viral defense system (DUF524 family)
MQIIKVEHIDFDLVIECNNLETTFNKAQKKQSNILTATSYLVNEGKISLYNFESKSLEPLNSDKTYPLIFENKDYFIDFTFHKENQIEKPHIYSKLKDVKEKFLYRENLGLLSGTINFGNDLGKSNLIVRYTKGNILQEINFQFEVFPTKLNYRSDYEKIVSDIEKEYPYLVLDFLKKTYSSFKSGNTPNTDLIWWQVFGGLYADFIHSSKYILNKPHSRIVKQTKYVKADRIQKWTSALEEEYSQFKSFPNKNYRSEYKTLSTNTSENRLFKHAVFQTKKRYQNVKKFIFNSFDNKLTNEFKNELSDIEKDLKIISINPFFRTIDDFQGIKQESLVLQKATGYSTIYKSWIMLNSGLKFLEGIQKIELKNIADLYQIWCFLEIKNVLQNILGKDYHMSKLAEIHIDDFVYKIERGVKSKVSFNKPNGETIELFHDLSYDTSTNQSEKSYTVNQKPDIVLRITKNDLKEKYVLTYLYDAKYRLASDEKEGSPDLPTEDSINQMHRYRDAIYYVNKDKIKPEKEVIGAYILFPGSGEIETIKNLDYYKSIDSVNIGAFPLRPNDYTNRRLLEDHLKTIIGLDTESVLNDVSPHKLTAYEKHNPEVLIGIVKKGIHSDYFANEQNLIYHTGKVKPSKLKDENSGYVKIKSDIKYFAPYYSGKGIKEFYEIEDFRIIPRNEIFKKPHPLAKDNDTSDRLIIRLGRKYMIDNNNYFTCPITVYRYTNLKNIRTPIDNKVEVLKVSQ